MHWLVVWGTPGAGACVNGWWLGGRAGQQHRSSKKQLAWMQMMRPAGPVGESQALSLPHTRAALAPAPQAPLPCTAMQTARRLESLKELNRLHLDRDSGTYRDWGNHTGALLLLLLLAGTCCGWAVMPVGVGRGGRALLLLMPSVFLVAADVHCCRH